MMSMAAISLAPASHLNTIIMRLFFLRLLCLVSAAELVPAWDWNNESQPIAIYRSVRASSGCVTHSVGNSLMRSVAILRFILSRFGADDLFLQRPDLLAPILTPLEGIHNPDKMAPGYFFVSPYTNMQPGLYIYDNYAVSQCSIATFRRALGLDAQFSSQLTSLLSSSLDHSISSHRWQA